MSGTVRVLGVDPGTAATGYGVVQSTGSGSRLLECGVIRTNVGDSLAARLALIFEGVTDLIARHKPDCMVIESAFYSRNVRTTLVLGHARGVILLAAHRGGVEIFEYSPAEIKKSVVGNGAATKEQVQFMITRLLSLRTPPEPSDAADGVAAALAHLSASRLSELTRRAGLVR